MNVLRGIKLVHGGSDDRDGLTQDGHDDSFRSLELGIRHSLCSAYYSALSLFRKAYGRRSDLFFRLLPISGRVDLSNGTDLPVHFLICHSRSFVRSQTRLRRAKAMRARIMCIRTHFILPAVTCMSDLAKFGCTWNIPPKGLGYFRVGLVSFARNLP